jgi:hypothetical protein
MVIRRHDLTKFRQLQAAGLGNAGPVAPAGAATLPILNP